jgi:hypothetical protein
MTGKDENVFDQFEKNIIKEDNNKEKYVDQLDFLIGCVDLSENFFL